MNNELRLKVVEVLQKARELISDQSRWTQGAYARSESGSMVPVTSPLACKFCVMGAITKTLTSDPSVEVINKHRHLLDLIYESIGRTAEVSKYGGVTNVNDVGGHEATMSMLSHAAEQFSV